MIIRAGFPMTRAPGGTSLVTIDPGSMNAPAPIRTPLRIVACGPIPVPVSTLGQFAQALSGGGAPVAAPQAGPAGGAPMPGTAMHGQPPAQGGQPRKHRTVIGELNLG